jgi:hypothetical protein
MTTPVRLLLVEDHPGDARLSKFSLNRMPHPVPIRGKVQRPPEVESLTGRGAP